MSVKNILRRFGLDIVRYHPQYEQLLTQLHIDTVIDIGASDGQYAHSVRALLPHAQIYSFEPLHDVFASLERSMARDELFKAFNIGLGEKNETLEINRSSFSPSSSFLPMADLHKTLFPKTSGSSKEIVAVRTLDDVALELNLVGNVLIKMDVQGFEDKVIRGGMQTLARASMLVVETSFVPLYVGQPLFDDIAELVRPIGFAYRGTREQHWNKQGELIYQDSLFVRS